MSDLFALTDLTIETRARAASKDVAKDFECGSVRVGQTRNAPRKREAGKLRREFLVGHTSAHLRWLAGDVDRIECHAWGGCKMFTELLVDLGSMDIADHDKSEVVWNVAGFVVIEDIFAGELVVHVEIPDDRMAIRAFLEYGIEHELGALTTGIIKSHRKLASDDFLFFGIFGFR